MPDTNSPVERLEWNEENFARVVSNLYREIETDQALHTQLLADPFAVLSARIGIPEEFRGCIFARQRYRKTLMLNVPAFEGAREALPEGTSETQTPPDYEPICTFPFPW